MKQVILKRLTIEGFKSFTRRSVIEFGSDLGTTFIAGRNEVEPRLGGNGAGKSTLWDAICFVQYGLGVRGAKINDLVSHGAKRCEVIAEYEIDGEPVELKRSGPPGRVYVGGKQVEQQDVDRLLGLSRQRFLNSVLFGQAMPLFLDMAIPERGNLLDEVLDLAVWMRAADRAGKRCNEITTELNSLKVEIGRTEGARSSLEDQDAIQAQIDAWDGERQVRRRSLQDELSEAENLFTTQSSHLDAAEKLERPDPASLFTLYKARKEVEAALRERLAGVRADTLRLSNDLNFFRDNAECPTCGQLISKATAKEHIARHEASLAELERKVEGLDGEIATANLRVERAQDRWNVAQVEAQRIAADVIRLRAAASSQRRIVEGLRGQITRLDAEANPHVVRLERVKEQRRALRQKLFDQKRQENSLTSQLMGYEFWKNGFRRVRLFCIDRVLKELELETMNAAQSLGLIGWRISYATETETKSGTAKLGVQAEVKSPTMSGQFINWSGGEGQRVRLAGALGLAGLIQRWSGVRWNVEIYDEPTAFLSDSGIEDLLELLKHRADSYGKSVYVADHRGLQNMGFDRVITVVKDAAGSRVMEGG